MLIFLLQNLCHSKGYGKRTKINIILHRKQLETDYISNKRANRVNWKEMKHKTATNKIYKTRKKKSGKIEGWAKNSMGMLIKIFSADIHFMAGGILTVATNCETMKYTYSNMCECWKMKFVAFLLAFHTERWKWKESKHHLSLKVISLPKGRYKRVTHTIFIYSWCEKLRSSFPCFFRCLSAIALDKFILLSFSHSCSHCHIFQGHIKRKTT